MAERTLKRTEGLADILTSTAPGNLNRALRGVPSGNLAANMRELRNSENDEEVWEVNTSSWVVPREDAVPTRNQKRRNKTLANFSDSAPVLTRATAASAVAPVAVPAAASPAPATNPFLAAAAQAAAARAAAPPVFTLSPAPFLPAAVVRAPPSAFALAPGRAQAFSEASGRTQRMKKPPTSITPIPVLRNPQPALGPIQVVVRRRKNRKGRKGRKSRKNRMNRKVTRKYRR